MNQQAFITINFPPGSIEEKRFVQVLREVRNVVIKETGITTATTGQYIEGNYYAPGYNY